MDNTRRGVLAGAGRLLAATGTASLSGLARAQAWPAKQIRIVVGYPAGGLTDTLARTYGEFIGLKLGKPVVIENKPGAAGMIAGAEVAKSAPDGHTLWFTITGTMNQNRVLFRSMPYDPDKAFVHVSGFDSGHLPLCVRADSPVKTVQDFVEMGRRQPVTLGTYSPGSLPHMMAQQLAKHHGMKIEPVHYRGESPMWVDVLSGQVTAGVGSQKVVVPHIQKGSLRPIAVPTTRRSPILPDVPTFHEQGLREAVFTIEGWLGLFAPAGTPREIVQRLSDLVQEASRAERASKLHRDYGMLPKPWTADEFAKFDREVGPRWVELARELNITLG